MQQIPMIFDEEVGGSRRIWRKCQAWSEGGGKEIPLVPDNVCWKKLTQKQGRQKCCAHDATLKIMAKTREEKKGRVSGCKALSKGQKEPKRETKTGKSQPTPE